MRATLQEICEKLGLDAVPASYETVPVSLYDADKGMTASAEIRMGPDQAEIEAEIQLIHDMPLASGSSLEQIMTMRAIPKTDGKWTPVALKVKGEDYASKFGGWEDKACEFYNAVSIRMRRNEMPDFETLIDEILSGGDYGGRRGGGASRKSPKIKPAQVLGMKQGGR